MSYKKRNKTNSILSTQKGMLSLNVAVNGVAEFDIIFIQDIIYAEREWEHLITNCLL